MTNLEKQFLDYITDHGLDLFQIHDLKNGLSFSAKQLNNTLANLLKSGMINHLERGKYCRYGFYDEKVIGCFVARNSCLSYWTALNFHGLTEQIPNTVFVQTDHQKASKTILGVKYQFVWLDKRKIFGCKTYGNGNHRFTVAEKEKTIIDCFDRPDYSGGYAEIIKGFYNARLNATRLSDYCKRFNNISLIKRLAYLIELLEKKELFAFLDFAYKIKNDKYNLFEIGGESKGEASKDWRLILNISEEEIKNMAVQTL
jgi:predicted transcriptional regulator of viral defense system